MKQERNITPINPKIYFKVLDQEKMEKIHQATMTVLEDVGAKFPSEKALKILEAHGAKVDWNTKIARIPADVVMKYIKKAPSTYIMGARNPHYDLSIDGKHSYLSTDGCGVEVYDLKTGELRPSCLKDVEESARVADYLPQISFYWGPMVAANDKPAELRGLYELEAAIRNCAKHVQPETIYSELEARYAMEMAVVLAGSKEEAKKRPPFSLAQCTMDPIAHHGSSLDVALITAENGIPTGFMPMSSCCSTGPATMAGDLVVFNAAALSGLVLLQMHQPGTPIFFSAAPTAMDLRSGAYTGGGPEDYLFGSACKQIAEYYNIPLAMGTFATGAKEPDWQAAVDSSFSCIMPVLAGADMLNGAGMLNGSKILSYQQIIMDCEIYRIVEKIAQGIEVNDETLAIDVIKKVGPTGNFLMEKHTREHLNNIWVPEIIDRTPFNKWLASGKKGAFEKATEKARWILQNHQPQPLEQDKAKELQRILHSAQKEADKKK
jgi:trimethylamine--corrinoid protein Co-methyltransferase